MSEPARTENLADLRVEIDRIDADMHALLMARGEIIDRLIAVKARQGGGSAFRPAREAEMMRVIAERHKGLLPLDTVEGIWRIIISTFTYMQANYAVHADDSGGDANMRDSVRFHFGFTVPYVAHHTPSGVIAAVAQSGGNGGGGDLGMVRATGLVADGAWWKALAGEQAPKIIARLPFVERPDHPAGLPVFIISHPLNEAAARDVAIYALELERWSEALPAAIGALGGEILGSAPSFDGLSILLAAPGGFEPAKFEAAIAAATTARGKLSQVGSHAARFRLGVGKSA